MDHRPTSLVPWLSVRHAKTAIAFYEAAFGAVDVFRMESPDGSVLARLSIDGVEFWVGDESPEHGNYSPQTLGGGTVRLILVVADPTRTFQRAVTAGAKVVFPVAEQHGWLVGRVTDPFGHPWEIGRPID